MKKRESRVEEFDPKRVRPLSDQPRTRFRGIKELAASIKEVGQQAPGSVIRLTGVPDFDVELIDGERRLRACIVAGVPFRAEVREVAGPKENQFTASFAANFGRQDHDVIEIAMALSRLQKMGKTIEQMARIAGRSTAWVVQHLSLLNLHPDVQALLIPADTESTDENGWHVVTKTRKHLTFSLALMLTSLTHELQNSLATRIVLSEESMASARRLIMRESRDAGISTQKTGKRVSRRRLLSVQKIVGVVEAQIGIFLDTPVADLRAIINEIDDTSKQATVDALYGLTDDLVSLADILESQIKSNEKKKPKAA